MATLIVSENRTETLAPHPGSAGFNALTCPTCGDRCGHLFDGKRCLGCEVGWSEPKPQVETDVLSYSCGCGRTWPSARPAPSGSS
jgi:hypothetical protein